MFFYIVLTPISTTAKPYHDTYHRNKISRYTCIVIIPASPSPENVSVLAMNPGRFTKIRKRWRKKKTLSNWEFFVWNWGKTYFLALGMGPHFGP